MRVLILPDYQALSSQAARIVAAAVAAKPTLTLGLPTGQTPIAMYGELVRRHQEGLDFSRVRTFNLDEYAGLALDHPNSYHAYMRHHFFDHVNVPAENIHFPSPESGGDAYEDDIRRAGGLDLVVAGIGSNGHVAFNEPGSSFDSRTRLVALAPETIENAGRHFEAGTEVPRTAITMGIATILEARQIVLLASGFSKAAAVSRSLNAPVTPEVPASVLQTHPDVIVILDSEAAEQFSPASLV